MHKKKPFILSLIIILGFAEMLSEELEERRLDDLKVYADNLYLASLKSYDLLENLLEWSRTQRNAVKVNKETLNLYEISDIVLEHFTDAIHEKSIHLENKVPKNATIHADANILHTVLRNLISNAVKFTPDNGTIRISAEEKVSHYIVSVSDTGNGIPEHIGAKLFRLNNDPPGYGTRNEKGSGLGLVIIKEFLEKHENKIWVESKEGEGSSFNFTIQKT